MSNFEKESKRREHKKNSEEKKNDNRCLHMYACKYSGPCGYYFSKEKENLKGGELQK